MKKGIKILLIILGAIVILGFIFFAVDYSRVQKQEKPIFCINYAIANDGGTKEYIGLGYKIIDFNRSNGYDEMKIGSWFMEYEDFENEYNYENNNISNIKVIVNSYNNIPKINITNENATKIKQILSSFKYNQELCDGIYSYEIIINDEEHYRIKQDCKAIEKGNKQAYITEEQLKSIEDIIENNIDKQTREIPSSQIQNIKKNDGYILTYDDTRDIFGTDTKIRNYDNIPSSIYTVDLVEDDDL